MKRSRRPSSQASLLPEGGEIRLAIARLGGQGDGIGDYRGKPVYVARALPGEIWHIRNLVPRQGGFAGYGERDAASASPLRVPPLCRHFAECGGCAMQHMAPAAYREWKTDLALAPLRQQGIPIPTALAFAETPRAARRRATFAATRRQGKFRFGFHRAASHDIVDLAECPVLAPELQDRLPDLRRLAENLLADSGTASLHATLGETGLDLLWTTAGRPQAKAATFVAGFADALGLARLHWQDGETPPDLLFQRASPQIAFGGIRVDLPPGAFLQPSAAGEAVLADFLKRTSADGKIRRALDLFCGCGTFALRLADFGCRRVLAIDSDAAALVALRKAADRAGFGNRIEILRRDLLRSPLPGADLAGFDFALFDPPRSGARDQAAILARSAIPRILGISCDPGSFARDARHLVDGGYRLTELLILDQFVWSAHVELAGLFLR